MRILGISYLSIFVVLMLCITSCKKDFLSKKPSTEILQPTTIEDFQYLLEYEDIVKTTGLGILASDEYTYRSYEIWQARTALERNSYIWAKDLYSGEVSTGHWKLPYKAIFYSNNIIAGLDKIPVTDLNRKKWNFTKGWALFVRANAYYDLVRNFSKAFDPSTAATDLGVPLRLNPSIGEVLQRSSVYDVYNRIILDLNEATSLLDPDLPVKNRNWPSKIAAYALAARVYLNMRDYSKAELSADNCLKLYNKLLDYNSLSLTALRPFAPSNEELIYFTIADGQEAYSSSTLNTETVVSSELINLYLPGDLRLPILFIKQIDGTYVVKRNISGYTKLEPFTGFATGEVYLIKAECAARRDDVTNSMEVLNRLLIKRYASDKFKKETAVSGHDALMKVLLERRKELAYRGLRWDDLKRLNIEGANIRLTRELNGEVYTLEPNSPKYVFPIPDDEINLSGIQQNQR